MDSLDYSRRTLQKGGRKRIRAELVTRVLQDYISEKSQSQEHANGFLLQEILVSEKLDIVSENHNPCIRKLKKSIACNSAVISEEIKEFLAWGVLPILKCNEIEIVPKVYLASKATSIS